MDAGFDFTGNVRRVIHDMIQRLPDLQHIDLSRVALSFAQADSIAYIIGGYKTVISDPDAGKFILTLRMMSDGKWYITADMDNPNR